MAIPFCLVLGVETSVTMAVARLTLPLARPPKILATTNVANVDAKHLKTRRDVTLLPSGTAGYRFE